MKLIIFLIGLAAVSAAAATGHKPFTSSLLPIIKSWADRFPTIKSLIDTRAATLPAELQAVMAEGYSELSHSASVQALDNIENFESFLRYLIKSLHVPRNLHLEILGSLEKFRLAADWSLVDILLDRKYACVLGHRNTKSGTYNFIVVEIEIASKLGAGTVLIEERASHLWGLTQRGNIQVSRIPSSRKLEDIELVKSFLNQAAMIRTARTVNVRVPELEESFAVDEALNRVIDAGLSIIPKVINLFKTTSTSRIIKEVVGQGFSHYEQSSRTGYFTGISDTNIIGFMVPSLGYLTKVKGDVLEGMKTALTLGVMSEQGAWTDYKIAFSQTGLSTVQFADVIVHNRGDGKFNVIFVAAEQVFRLAPNIRYIESSKSYVGGIYQETKIERQEIPRELTKEDLNVLCGFFHITSFQRLGNSYGIKVPELPDKPEMKP